MHIGKYLLIARKYQKMKQLILDLATMLQDNKIALHFFQRKRRLLVVIAKSKPLQEECAVQKTGQSLHAKHPG